MNKDKILMVVIMLGIFAFLKSPAWNYIGGKFMPAPPQQEIPAEQEKSEPSLLSAPAAVEEPTLTGSAPVEEKETVAVESVEEEPAVTVFDTTVIENSLLKLTVAGDGARIISVKVKGFAYAEKMKRGGDVELVADRANGIAATAINGASLNGVAFSYAGAGEGRHTFVGKYKGVDVRKTFSLQDSSYVVGYEVESELLTNKNSTILFGSGINETETLDNRGLKYSPRQIALYSGKKVEKLTFKKAEKRREDGIYDWAALTSRYFTMVALPSVQQETGIEMLSSRVTISDKAKPDNLIYSFALTAPAMGTKSNYDLYLGPTRIKDLKSLNVGLEKTVFRGYGWFFGANIWFPKLCELVLWGMNLFSGIFRDYGIAIIMITLILRGITYPLTNSSMKSMSKMKDMQPRLQAIQEKYKNNPQLMQAKLMEFYKEEGVNPLSGLGGCIPMFLQMPIMISLFVVLRKAVELRGQDTFLLPWVNDLSQKESLFDLPFTLPVVNIDSIAILPFAMAILMFFQNKMTMKGNTQDPNQRMMLYMMPLMMFFMFYNMPAGLTLYFTFSSVIHIVQQYFVDKKKKSTESSVTVVK